MYRTRASVTRRKERFGVGELKNIRGKGAITNLFKKLIAWFMKRGTSTIPKTFSSVATQTENPSIGQKILFTRPYNSSLVGKDNFRSKFHAQLNKIQEPQIITPKTQYTPIAELEPSEIKNVYITGSGRKKNKVYKKKVLIHRHKKVSGKQKSTVNHNKKTLVKSFKKLRAVSQPRITRLQRRLENLRTVDAQL
jgi:hypothetical protein